MLTVPLAPAPCVGGGEEAWEGLASSSRTSPCVYMDVPGSPSQPGSLQEPGHEDALSECPPLCQGAVITGTNPCEITPAGGPGLPPLLLWDISSTVTHGMLVSVASCLC